MPTETSESSRNGASEDPRPAPTRRGGRRGLRLARIFGIEIRLDPSVLVIFGLVVFGLATGAFPEWHPEWSVGLAWGTALGAGVLFFLSLLLHELAHSVVAKMHGLPVPRITLFLFGGVSEMQREPETPRSEFLIAVVGPATSLAIGFLCAWIAAVLAGPEFAERLADAPEEALAGLDPLTTLLFWLGPVNVMLGVFNLVPGFPLDGGRLLRAGLWWITGNLERATRHASFAGQIVAWGLMGIGLVELLAGRFQGVWLLLIGWFLNHAAKSSYEQLLVRRALKRLHVADLMRTRFDVADEDLPLSTFVEERLLRSGQPVWPVEREGRLVGLVTLDEVRAVPADERPRKTLRDVMKPIEEPVSPDLRGRDALDLLSRRNGDPLPVVRDGRVVGLLHQADVFRWMALHEIDSS